MDKNVTNIAAIDVPGLVSIKVVGERELRGEGTENLLDESKRYLISNALKEG